MDLNVIEEFVARMENMDEEIDENDIMLGMAMFLFDDESESDDEENGQEPFVWTKVTANIDEYRFMQNVSFRLHFRMSRVVFEELVLKVGPALAIHTNKNIGHVLLMSLWILATPDTFRSVALRFGVSPGVLHMVYKKVVDVLCDEAPNYVQWPNADERARIEERFRISCGLSGVVGAVDGTHIYIVRPGEDAPRFVNRHGTFSIALQGVCDDSLLFRDVYVGESGRLHDSRVFRRSPLSAKLLEDENSTYLSPDQYLLGDGAYILTDKLLKPFRNVGNLTPVQRHFNVCLASGRVVIEQAFGRLKGKWRRLKYLYKLTEESIVKHVMACIMLHNFLLCEGEPFDEGEINQIEPQPQLEGEEAVEAEDPLLDHPNVAVEPDHPLLEDARARGVEWRLHMAQLVFDGN